MWNNDINFTMFIFVHVSLLLYETKFKDNKQKTPLHELVRKYEECIGR